MNLRGPAAGIIWGLFALMFVVCIGVVGFALIERWSILDSFYMTVISISTVGYGEVRPLSPPGRVFATIIIITGLGSAFFTTTMLGRVILESELRGTLRRRRMRRSIESLNKHTILCGFGRTGRIVAESMNDEGEEMVILESNREMETALLDMEIPYLIGDATAEHVLRSAGIDRAACVLCLLSSDADNLYLTMMAREMNPAIKIVARALDDMAERRLKRGGANSVVSAHKIAAHRVLQAAIRPTVNEFIDLVSDRQQLSLIMEELKIEQTSSLCGRSLEHAGIRSNFHVIVIAIKRPSGEMIFYPDGKQQLVAGDIIIAIGEEAGLQKLGTALSGSFVSPEP